jgi:hypothetical protein
MYGAIREEPGSPEEDFVIGGPGAEKGLRMVSKETMGYRKYANLTGRINKELQERAEARKMKNWRESGMEGAEEVDVLDEEPVVLRPIDVEHVLCELQKYVRCLQVNGLFGKYTKMAQENGGSEESVICKTEGIEDYKEVLDNGNSKNCLISSLPRRASKRPQDMERLDSYKKFKVAEDEDDLDWYIWLDDEVEDKFENIKVEIQ